MKKKFNLKAILASALVTASLCIPTVVLSATGDGPLAAELIFQGADLRYCADGSVQAIFDVAIDKVINSWGASFHLSYNNEYMTPSYIEDTTDAEGFHSANEPIRGTGILEEDAFFQEDSALYGAKDENGDRVPLFSESNFSFGTGSSSYYSRIDTNAHRISMTLWIDQTAVGEHGEAGKVGVLRDLSEDEGRVRYTLNTRNSENNVFDPTPAEKIVLGQLSFRIEKEHLAEVVDLFGNMDVTHERRKDKTNTADLPYVDVKSLAPTGEETFLLDIKDVPNNEDPYQIGSYTGPEGNRPDHNYYAPDRTDTQIENADNVGDRYIYEFDRSLIINVEATNPEITINAYQNFTDGDEGDLPISLGRYCPTVTVTYADGSKENVPFPWGGRTQSDGSVIPDGYRVISGLENPYDPTHGDYWFTQDYVYYGGRYPVTAHMTVTPITVLDVTADDLERTYPLETVVNQVPNANALNLPNQARIITDIVPSGVSLVTPIKGWKPVNGVWPTAVTTPVDPGHEMNSLLADGHAAGSDGVDRPYWPDKGDGTPLTAANHVGTYTFHTSDAAHTTDEDILKTDIQAAFPWLTVPKDSYPLTLAKRRIVPASEYPDPTDYAVKYVSTVTQTSPGNGDGQPTLTLSVEHANPSESMGANSIFRVWLPNGMELGTGQVGGGVTVTDWFGGATFADHTHGYYKTESKANTTTSANYFHLITNPDDPTVNASGAERETLRRYINLGGWYKVAICENPNTADPNAASSWTDPIPVYVPPRPNEYQESKIYNFIGENAALFNWPGGVGDTLYLPQGDYTPVGPMAGDTTGSGNGLPLYDLGGTVTDGQGAAAADVFEDGNFHRVKRGVQRYRESYGVKTTYDGQTGAQPGTIYNVKVNAADKTHTDEWKKTHDGYLNPVLDPAAVYQYGPTPLYHGHRVPAYGTIYNVETAAGNGDYTTHKATLRTQLEEPPAQLREEIRLVSYSPTGITRVVQNDYESNVTLVTYDAKMEGYTVRQDYVLTIKNVGDVDIYGLDIDGLTDGYPDDKPGGRFEMLQPPASFLPAGSSTTFTLTYVYDLRSGADKKPFNYRDTLYITSTSHPTPGKYKADGTVDNHGDYLLDFDAEFTVSKDPLHKVTVVYKPENGNMGTAGLIVGEQGTGANTVMNYTTTTRTYPQEDVVYVVVNKVDEYAVKSITMTDSAGTAIKDNDGNDIVTYSGTATLNDGTEVYIFEMPDQDVVVHVDFYEPILSKLRLNDLIEFSSPPMVENGAAKDADLVHGYDGATGKAGGFAPTDKADHVYKLWQKQFEGSPAKGSTAATGDYKDAADWSQNHTNDDENYYLMTEGAAIPRAQGGDVYDSSKSHYLVVIDAEDDFSQLKATLRAVQFHEDYQGKAEVGDADYDQHKNGYNDDIKPTVNMTVFYADQVRDKWQNVSVATTVYDPDHGYGPYDESKTPVAHNRPMGDTAGKTIHTSQEFDSPKPGESAYAHITVSLGLDTRHYYVEIHRKTKDPEVVLHYGNSPYGMIMNAEKFVVKTDGKVDAAKTAEAREAAKKAFRAKFTFKGLAATNLPKAVEDGGLDQVTYWREAWVRNEGLFEPESFTNINDYKDPNDINPAVYSNAKNLDMNDYSFFAVLGQDIREPGVISAKDSSGREVPLYKISAHMIGEKDATGITLLDTTQTKQVDRFSGTKDAVIDLGIAGRTLTFKTPADTLDAADAQLGAKNWPLTSTTTTTSPTDGSEPVTTTTYTAVTDLRPGQYLIEYTFTDFDGDSTLHVTRPLVILREVGDVNVDGKRDSGSHTAGTDEYAIEDRVTSDPLGYEAGKWDATNGETVYPHANIFKFRVCDVNNDRNINNIDANQVAENVKKSGGWLKFYNSKDYGLTAPEVTAPAAPATPTTPTTPTTP